MGNIYNSRYQSGPMITMHKKLKLSHGYKDNTPGPGSYMTFSQFGMWVPKNYDRNSYNVRKRVQSANPSSFNIRNFFRKKRGRTYTDNSFGRSSRIITAIR